MMSNKEIRVCQSEGCENIIPEGTHARRKYCTDACKQKHHSKVFAKKRHEKLCAERPLPYCRQCGMEIPDTQHLNAHYCSTRCRELGYAEKQCGRNSRHTSKRRKAAGITDAPKTEKFEIDPKWLRRH